MKTYIVLATKRSGHHAVVNWLCMKHDSILHLNDCKHFMFHNGMMFSTTSNDFNFYKKLPDHYVVEKYIRYNLAVREEILYEAEDFLLSFENINLNFVRLDELQHLPFMKKGSKPNAVIPIIVLSDPYNWLASCLGNKDVTDRNLVAAQTTYWLQHARQFMHPTIPNLIRINFNNWCYDPTYRRMYERDLGVPVGDLGKELIGAYPSSFEGWEKDGEASKMKLRERWQVFKDDFFYKSLLTEEIKDLSAQIFNFRPF